VVTVVVVGSSFGGGLQWLRCWPVVAVVLADCRWWRVVAAVVARVGCGTGLLWLWW
jgi:hypothetical protein